MGLGRLDPCGVISITGFMALLMTLGYTVRTMSNWNRIPFTATNLYTVFRAIRCTADIAILGLASLIVAFGVWYGRWLLLLLLISSTATIVIRKILVSLTSQLETFRFIFHSCSPLMSSE